MPGLVAEVRAVTLKYESIVTPDPVPTLSEREQWELEHAELLTRIDVANAKQLTLEMELAMAMDALKVFAADAAATIVAIEAEDEQDARMRDYECALSDGGVA